MIHRRIEKELGLIRQEFPVIAILGPRQSGKTTSARSVFPDYEYVSLEDIDIRQFAQEDPRGFLRTHPKRVILDEIQRVPKLFSYLQTHVDTLQENGSVIITGSHNFLLIEQISQSLAGRVGIVKLLPFSYGEIQVESSVDALYTQASILASMTRAFGHGPFITTISQPMLRKIFVRSSTSWILIGSCSSCAFSQGGRVKN